MYQVEEKAESEAKWIRTLRIITLTSGGLEWCIFLGSSNCRLERLRHKANGLIEAKQHQHPEFTYHRPEQRQKNLPEKQQQFNFCSKRGLWKGSHYGHSLSSLENKEDFRWAQCKQRQAKVFLPWRNLPTWAKPYGRGLCFPVSCHHSSHPTSA